MRSEENSAASLREHALVYLARFPATKFKLRKVLLRWTSRRGIAVVESELDALIEDLLERGDLDDSKFALARAQSLLRRGSSWVDIRSRLGKDGIGREQIQQTIEALTQHEDSAEVELLAALRVAQKKRLGPFGGNPSSSQAEREKAKRKDIGTLARKGFGWSIVQKIMQASDEELEEWQKKLQEHSR